MMMCGVALAGCEPGAAQGAKPPEVSMPKREEPKEDLKAKLTPEQYYVCVQKGTERPFSGKYVHFKGKGTYVCSVCRAALFDSKTKYDSGSGWPSFWDAIEPGSIRTDQDNSLWMPRIEIMCARCGSHLGHVFDDGPEPTGRRYCVNSVSLDFVEAPPEKK
jgi:peptide-methionine (R)-S-oxide reductase